VAAEVARRALTSIRLSIARSFAGTLTPRFPSLPPAQRSAGPGQQLRFARLEFLIYQDVGARLALSLRVTIAVPVNSSRDRIKVRARTARRWSGRANGDGNPARFRQY
jgi:hypothetical protein